jgi:hypothetical protein
MVVYQFIVGARILHRIEENPDDLQYKQIFKHVMVSSVRLLYPNGEIQFQQDHSFFHDSHVVRKWLSWLAGVELIDWLL